MPTSNRGRGVVAGVTAAAVIAPAIFIAMPAVAAEPDSVAPVIASITPGDGSFVSGTTTFVASVVEENVSYSYLEFNRNGVWLTDDTKSPGSVKYGNEPKLVVDTTKFADGAYGVKVDTADKSGNKAEKKIAVTVDNTKPVVTTNLVDGQFVKGVQDVVVTVAEKNPLAYHAQLYRQDGTQVAGVNGYAYAPTGSTLTIPAVDWNALADGAYYLLVSVRDKAGNTASLKVNVLRDATRPALEILSPASGAALRPGAPGVVALSASDASGLTGVVANLYDGDNKVLLGAIGRDSSATGTTWSGSFALPTGLADGLYTVRAGTNDKAGNNRTVSQQFRIDGTAPVVTIDTPAVDTHARRTVTVSGTATDAGAGIAEVVLHVRKVKDNGKLDGFLNEVVVPVVDGAWSTTLDTKQFADGSYGITVLGTDLAGNTNGGGVHVKPLTFDNTVPTLTIGSPAPGAALVQGALGQVSLTAGDALGLGRLAVNLYDAGNATLLKAIGSTSAAAPIGTTTWSGSFALPADLAPGSYTLRASVTDLSGNSTTITSAITVEVPAPPAPPADPEPSAPSLTGWLAGVIQWLLGLIRGLR